MARFTVTLTRTLTATVEVEVPDSDDPGTLADAAVAAAWDEAARLEEAGKDPWDDTSEDEPEITPDPWGEEGQ